MCRGSSDCHSATFAAASYFSDPVRLPLATAGASSFQTCSLSPGETSTSSVKSRSEPEYPHRLHVWIRYGRGCVPAALSWKSVLFPPNEFVETTVCDRKRFSQTGHRSSIACSVVIGPPFLIPALHPVRRRDFRKRKNCATRHGDGISCVRALVRTPG
jgi:hypothetical protein